MQESFVKNHIQLDIEVYYILPPIFLLLLCNLSWDDLPAFLPAESSYYCQDPMETHKPYTNGALAASGLKWGGHYLYSRP